jgi:hypothetical protein
VLLKYVTPVLSLICQMVQLQKLIVEHKKRFWAEIGEAMGKFGLGCEKAAKEAKLPMYVLMSSI